MWLARVFRNNPGTWSFGGGIFDDDVIAIANGGRIHVAGLSYFTPWYRTWYVGVGWLAWSSPGGVLQHMTAAVFDDMVYVCGQDAGGAIWWNGGGQWTRLGNRNAAANSRFSAGPR